MGQQQAALLQLAGVYRADPGKDGHRTAATPLGGFLDRIAETITRAGAAAGKDRPGTQVPARPAVRP
jgi:hypothetical protein